MTRITGGRGFGKTRRALIEARNLGVHDAINVATALLYWPATKATLTADVRGVDAKMTQRLRAAYAAGAREALGHLVTVKTPSGDAL